MFGNSSRLTYLSFPFTISSRFSVSFSHCIFCAFTLVSPRTTTTFALAFRERALAIFIIYRYHNVFCNGMFEISCASHRHSAVHTHTHTLAEIRIQLHLYSTYIEWLLFVPTFIVFMMRSTIPFFFFLDSAWSFSPNTISVNVKWIASSINLPAYANKWIKYFLCATAHGLADKMCRHVVHYVPSIFSVCHIYNHNTQIYILLKFISKMSS